MQGISHRAADHKERALNNCHLPDSQPFDLLRQRTCFDASTPVAILLASLAATPCAIASSTKVGLTDGTFVGIEQGDYTHFLIKDMVGRPRSFLVLRPDRSVQPYLINRHSLKAEGIVFSGRKN